MADQPKWVSTTIPNGPEFDEYVGRLLNYRPESWGYVEISYHDISERYNAPSDNIYYLPPGNYRLLDAPANVAGVGLTPRVSEGDTYSSINLRVFSGEINQKIYTLSYGDKYLFRAELNSVSDTLTWSDITNLDGGGEEIIEIVVSITPPSDTSILWIDISEFSVLGSASLKGYVDGAWRGYVVPGMMEATIYDPNKEEKDMFNTTVDSIKIILDEYAVFVLHKENKLPLLHVTVEEKAEFALLKTVSEVNAYFSEGGDGYTYIMTHITDRSASVTKIEESSSGVSTIEDKFNSHLATHITSEDVNFWSNKSGTNHTHLLDERVMIFGCDVTSPLSSNPHEFMILPSDTILTNIIYGNGVYLAIIVQDGTRHNYYRYLYSYDGISWTENFVNAGVQSVPFVDYGNNRFLLCLKNGSSSVNVYSSFDGVMWAALPTSDIDHRVIKVCGGNNGFMLVVESSVSEDLIYYTIDGITTQLITGIRNYKIGMVYHSGTFYCSATKSSDNSVSIMSIDIVDLSETLLGNTFIPPNTERTYIVSSDDNLYFVGSDSEATAHIPYLIYKDNTFVQILSITGIPKYFFSYMGCDYCISQQIDDSFILYSSNDSFTWNIVGSIQSESIVSANGLFFDMSENVLVLPSTIASSILPRDIFERGSLLSSLDVLENGITDEELNSIYHDGNQVYVNTLEGYLFYEIIDNTKFNTVDYLNGLIPIALKKDVPTWNNVVNEPSTIAGYGITNGISNNGLEEFVDNKLSSVSIPYGYSENELISSDFKSPIYIGVQKTLGDSGGTVEYPMSDENAQLDIILGRESSNILSWVENIMGDTSRYWRSVCYGKDRFVAVADNSTYSAYTLDGITWVENTISSTSRYWTSVCYGNDRFVSVAWNSNYSAYSLDGITWIENTISSTIRNWYSVCYGKDRFVAVADNSTYSAYSLDGITWIENTISSTIRNWVSVCYGNDRFVTVAFNSNYSAYSLDGITWIENTISSTIRYWYSVCYGKDRFVAVASSSNYSAYSLDGITWIENMISSTRRNWWSVCYGSDRYVAVCTDDGYSAYSLDGITWVENTISSTNRKWNSVCYGKDKFVAVCVDDGYSTYLEIPDIYPEIIKLRIGNNGPSILGEWSENNISSTIRNWSSVCYGKDKFVAVCDDDGYSAYSLDGITWVEDMIGSTNRKWSSVCYGNSRFVAVVYNSTISAYSLDGIIWIENTISSTSRNWWSVCYGNDRFVTVTNGSNYSAYSLDGITWIENEISGTSRSWFSVCYGNDRFVVVVFYSNISAYSLDGITWIENTISSTSRSWHSVCYGKDRYVTVASSSNYSAYSLDGITWIENTISGTSRSWFSVCYGKDKFVAVCNDDGYSAYSLDGITWIENKIGSTNRYWTSVCYDSGRFVAVADRSNYSAISIIYEPHIVIEEFGDWSENTISSTSREWRSVCYGKDRFVAIVYDSIYSAYSLDGITWIENTISSTSRNWCSVCYGNDRFVTVASSSNYSAYSLDGIIWIENTISSTNRNWRSVCYGKDRYVTVASSSNYSAYSLDGIIWIENTISSTSRNWWSVCYGSDRYVAVASSSTYSAYSLDGITWIENTISSTNRKWNSVCYGKDKFVAVAYNSNISAYSLDGITWVENTISDTIRIWYSLYYGKDRYVTVCTDAGYSAYSLDGIIWIENTISGTSREWISICYGNDRFVAVAYNSNYSAYLLNHRKEIYNSVAIKSHINTGQFDTFYRILDYFSYIYQEDTDNPKWISDGLGFTLKIENPTLIQDNTTIISKVYTLNNKTYKISILWSNTETFGLKPGLNVIVTLVDTIPIIEDSLLQMDKYYDTLLYKTENILELL